MNNCILGNYREADRHITDNVKKVEFVNTTRILDEYVQGKSKILDCAAGAGIYAIHFAKQDYEVTAADIIPRNIDAINERLANENCSMKTAVLNAADMSMFADESFDVVLNMGAFYHLPTEKLREKCISECVRVLRKGGILVTSYIPIAYVLYYAAARNGKYLDDLAKQTIRRDKFGYEKKKCFWRNVYCSSKDEMKKVYLKHGLRVVDHFSKDGSALLLSQKTEQWNEAEFEIWCDYHYSLCRKQSILEASNHVIIIGEK